MGAGREPGLPDAPVVQQAVSTKQQAGQMRGRLARLGLALSVAKACKPGKTGPVAERGRSVQAWQD